MIVGYARTSTVDQIAGFEAQRKELAAPGCEKVFEEQVSSVAERKQLQAAMDYVREGDIFVVTKLDRLARSVINLMTILVALEQKRVGIRILNLGMDTQTPTGKLMLTVLGAVAQFEREMMLERQREGTIPGFRCRLTSTKNISLGYSFHMGLPSFLRIALVFSPLLVSANARGQSGPNAGEVTANVTETKVASFCGNGPSCSFALDIRATINGRTFWLESTKTSYSMSSGILELGTYKARLVLDEHPTDYKFRRTYTLLYNDGKTQDFGVIGESK